MRECIINDIDGTLNKNYATTLASKKSRQSGHRVQESVSREIREGLGEEWKQVD